MNLVKIPSFLEIELKEEIVRSLEILFRHVEILIWDHGVNGAHAISTAYNLIPIEENFPSKRELELVLDQIVKLMAST